MAGIPDLMRIDISGPLKTGVPGLGYGTSADTLYGGLGKKALNAMNAAERDDYPRSQEFASPSFLESIMKAYRMAEQGAITPRGKLLTDEQGKPIRLTGREATAQPMGFRPERGAQISGEDWTMDNVNKHYADFMPATARPRPGGKGRKSSGICRGSTWRPGNIEESSRPSPQVRCGRQLRKDRKAVYGFRKNDESWP